MRKLGLLSREVLAGAGIKGLGCVGFVKKTKEYPHL